MEHLPPPQLFPGYATKSNPSRSICVERMLFENSVLKPLLKTKIVLRQDKEISTHSPISNLSFLSKLSDRSSSLASVGSLNYFYMQPRKSKRICLYTPNVTPLKLSSPRCATNLS